MHAEAVSEGERKLAGGRGSGEDKPDEDSAQESEGKATQSQNQSHLLIPRSSSLSLSSRTVHQPPLTQPFLRMMQRLFRELSYYIFI